VTESPVKPRIGANEQEEGAPSRTVGRPLPSRPQVIRAIMRKDLAEYKRDRLWVILSALTLVMFIVVFWLLPSTVDETLTVGVHGGGLGQALEQVQGQQGEGMKMVRFSSPEDLRAAVSGTLDEDRVKNIPGADKVAIGILFPDDFASAMALGKRTSVEVLADAPIPSDVRMAVSAFVREMAYSIAGNDLPVKEPLQETVVLGKDRAGEQVSAREKMRPLFAFFVLIVESFALASLIASEIQHRTVTALLVTPARTADVLAAKALTGTTLALGQTLVFLIAVRAFTGNVGALLAAVVLGAIMASAVGMISGAAGRDFMGTLFYGILFVLPLSIPAFSILFPGAASFWVKVLPSYGIVEAMIGATSYDLSWSALAPELGLALAWDALLVGVALIALKRKVETI